VVRLLLIACTALAACYAPEFSDCTIACGPGDACPPGLSCRDRHCRVPDAPASCPSRCSRPPELFLCDGFEGTLGQPQWSYTVNDPGTTIELDRTRTVRGIRSLHTAISASGLATARAFVALNGAGSDPYFQRMFVYLPATLPAARVTLAGASQRDTTGDQIKLTLDPGRTLRVTTTNARIDRDSLVRLETERWHCLEWMLGTAGPGKQETRVWLEDVEVTDLATVFDADTVFDGFGIGLDLRDAPPPMELWFDEMAVSGARIGCQR
jgi:hypothetical protein